MSSDSNDRTPRPDDPHARVKAVLAGERAADSLGDLTHEELHFIADRGDELFAAGQVEGALQVFELLVRLQPDEYLFQTRVGAARQAVGRFEDAITAYDEALRLNQWEVTAATNRAAALIQLGRYEDAEDNLARVLRMDPEGRHPHTARARDLSARLAAAKPPKKL